MMMKRVEGEILLQGLHLSNNEEELYVASMDRGVGKVEGNTLHSGFDEVRHRP